VSREWDAPAYERNSAPIAAMGSDVLARLRLRGDETVIDAGCGTGRVTELLAARLPEGRVIAVDGSADMVRLASARLEGATVVHSDLLELTLPEAVDAVFSTATFHWILDHDALFGRLRALLRAGGQLVAQCGGEGNIGTIRAAIGRIAPAYRELANWPGPWNFASPEQTQQRLLRAGFSQARCWREVIPVQPEEPREYFRTLVLGAHLDRLPPEQHDAFTEAVLAELPEPHVDYVRLNIDAIA
jgi:trans-aconitate 2-methyltransferase